MRKSLWLILPVLAVVLASLFLRAPIPQFLTEQIPSFLSSQLPSGWQLRNWQIHAYSLWDFRSGQLPSIAFDLNHGEILIPVELSGQWNQSLSKPEFFVDFRLHIKSPQLTTSPLTGRASMQVHEELTSIDSWTLQVIHARDFQIKPYGKIDDFNLIVIRSEDAQINGNLQIKRAQFHSDLGQGSAKVLIKDANLAAVVDLEKSSWSGLFPAVGGVIGSIELENQGQKLVLQDNEIEISGTDEAFTIGYTHQLAGKVQINGEDWQLTSETMNLKSKLAMKGQEWQFLAGDWQSAGLQLTRDDEHQVGLGQFKISGQGNTKDWQSRLWLESGFVILGRTVFYFANSWADSTVERGCQ